MDRLVTLVRWLATAEDGQDLLEYAMLCALIALVAMGAVSTLGNKINTVFWQAIAAGNWGQHWSLFALRLPSVLYTFLTTALLAFFTLRISTSARTACLAAALYLLYFSTFRYGRAYLTSAPETFWLALPMWWVLWLRVRGAPKPHQTASLLTLRPDRAQARTLILWDTSTSRQ